jgi:hypothetical protein
MKGTRKLQLGYGFLIVAGLIAVLGIMQGSDLLGLAGIITALASGMLTVMWGNSQEHKHS